MSILRQIYAVVYEGMVEKRPRELLMMEYVTYRSNFLIHIFHNSLSMRQFLSFIY
jgi:hypothetical protein